MNALIIGGNGFIGSHLIDKLLNEGHFVRVLDKYQERYRSPLPDVEYCYGEFGNRGLLLEALKDIDVVFHLVSTTLPKTSNDDPVFDVQSNVIETLFLLEQCVAVKIKKIVFTSSGGTVYGKTDILPITELSPTEPECSYGISKLTIEKYLALYKQLFGLNYTIIRPANPYGPRQNPDGIQGAIPVFLNKVVKGQEIEIWGDGEVVRDFIHVSDLVEGIYKCSVIDTKSKIFNIGSGSGNSLNELVELIKQITHKNVQVKYKPVRSFDVKKVYLDITRAQQELNWSPAIALPQGIFNTWQFIQTVGTPNINKHNG